MEVGLAVAIDVALQDDDAAVWKQVKLASLVVERTIRDEFEVLIAMLVGVGIDTGEINDVFYDNGIQVEDRVAFGALLISAIELKMKTS